MDNHGREEEVAMLVLLCSFKVTIRFRADHQSRDVETTCVSFRSAARLLHYQTPGLTVCISLPDPPPYGGGKVGQAAIKFKKKLSKNCVKYRYRIFAIVKSIKANCKPEHTNSSSAFPESLHTSLPSLFIATPNFVRKHSTYTRTYD